MLLIWDFQYYVNFNWKNWTTEIDVVVHKNISPWNLFIFQNNLPQVQYNIGVILLYKQTKY